MDSLISKEHVTAAEASPAAQVPMMVEPDIKPMNAAMRVTVPERPVPLEVKERFHGSTGGEITKACGSNVKIRGKDDSIDVEFKVELTTNRFELPM